MQDNLLPLLERFKLPIALSFLGLVLIIGGIFSSGLNKQKNNEFPKESLVEGVKLLSIDVSGAVLNPGVYKLKDGSRIEDGIKAAGGFLEEASFEYISKSLNLAQKLTDGSKLYIPFKGESYSGGVSGSVAGTNTQAKVNINASTQGELEALPGIGPVTASKIISNRPYQQIEELVGKKVVGKAVFEKIKDLVVVY